MATIANLNVLLSLSSKGFTGGLNNALSEMAGFNQKLAQIARANRRDQREIFSVQNDQRRITKEILQLQSMMPGASRNKREALHDEILALREERLLNAQKIADLRRIGQMRNQQATGIRSEAADLQKRFDAEQRTKGPGFFGPGGPGRMIGSAAMAPFRRGLELANGALRQFSLNLSGAYYHLGPFSMRVGPGAAALIGLATGLKAAATSAVETAADFEKTEIAFEVMTGSAERAQAVLKQIYDFAAVTPFEIKDVTKAVQQFTAVGIEAETAFQMVKRLGNIAAAMPDSMADNLHRVVQALSQMHAKGTVQAEEMTRQLSNAGIPAWEALAHRIGVDVPEAMRRARAGMISAREAILAILDLANSPRFATMQARQAQTMLGLWSTLKDNVTLFMRDLGQLIIKGFDLKGATTNLTDFFQFLRSKLGEIEPAIMKIGTVFRATFDVALGLLKMVVERFGAWTSQIGASNSELNQLRDVVIGALKSMAVGAVEAVETVANAIIKAINLIGPKLEPMLGGLLDNGAGKSIERIASGGLSAALDAAIAVAAARTGGVPQPHDPLMETLLQRREELNKHILRIAPKTGPFQPLSTLNLSGTISDLNKLFQGFTSAAMAGEKAARVARMVALGFLPMGTAIGFATQNLMQFTAADKINYNKKYGELGKLITDARAAGRTQIQEMQDDWMTMFAELKEQSVWFIGQGLINPLLLARQEAGNVVEAFEGAQLHFFNVFQKMRREVGELKDTPAMEKGSREAGSVINRALNQQGRNDDWMKAVAEKLVRDQDEFKKDFQKFAGRFPELLKILGVK